MRVVPTVFSISYHLPICLSRGWESLALKTARVRDNLLFVGSVRKGKRVATAEQGNRSEP